jgi:ABC-type glutathione transport system ATPase component
LEELVEANPKEKELKATEGEIYLEVKNLKKSYLNRGGNTTTKVLALDGFSVALSQRQTLAIIGTSGSGKSTFAKLLVGLEKPDSGEVWLNGQPLKLQPPTGVQMVFQDPLASLNLRQSAKQAMIEILKFKHPQKRKEEYEQIAVELLRKVGFDDRLIEARPRQMSGGQRQRLCIAKALATEPKVLILDEAVAALDPLIQKQILDLLKEIQQSEGLIYLFITHNLDVARSMADVSIYLNEGKMAEIPESWSV